MICSESIYT